MTVNELINILRRLPQDMQVIAGNDYDGISFIEEPMIGIVHYGYSQDGDKFAVGIGDFVFAKEEEI